MKIFFSYLALMITAACIFSGCAYTRAEYIGDADYQLGCAVGERILGELNCFRMSGLTNARERNDEADKFATAVINPMRDERYWVKNYYTKHKESKEDNKTIWESTEVIERLHRDIIVKKALDSIDHIAYGNDLKLKCINLVLDGQAMCVNDWLYFRGLYYTLKY